MDGANSPADNSKPVAVETGGREAQGVHQVLALRHFSL
jgi:hypothetical protein